MKKIFSLCIVLILLTAAFMPLEHEDDQKKNKSLFKNNGTDEKWQFSVYVKRHLEMTEMTASICGDPCNCTRIDFQSTSDIVYSFSGETDVIPQGSDVLVMLESDKGGGDTKYSNKTITTDLCTGKSCTETSEGSGKVTSTGGYFDYKPSSKEGLLFMNYNLEGNINAIDCFGASSEIPIDGTFFVTLSQPQYMNFNLSDQVDSLYKTREREYDSLKHLLPDWMPKIDFAEIEKSRQTERDTLEKVEAKSYVDKYALKVTEKESGYLAAVTYTKSIEIPKTDEYHEGYTKYTFTENITVDIGAPSDIKLKQISKDWVPEKDSLVDVTVKWQGTKIPDKLKFTIYDVSSEPGECLNSESDDASPDLEFDWDGLFDFEKISESEIIVKPEAYSGNECTISLKSKDYGTYAKLKAEGDFGNGWVPINADETNEYYIRIPYDINLNFIADKWEKDVGVFGMNLPPKWDEDPEPANQRRNGDGYVLYEEYRGFNAFDHLLKKPDNVQIKDGHFRSDPLYKDVFVFPEGFSFKSLYKLNPANLNWHIIERNDMVYNSADAETHRWVNNKTSKKYYYAKQYAINTRMIFDVPLSDSLERTSGGVAYQLNWIFGELDTKLHNLCVDGFSHPLKCFAVCLVFLDNIYAPLISSVFPHMSTTDFIMMVTEQTLIHEIGHNLGIPHHGGGTGNDSLTYELPVCSMRYLKSNDLITPVEFEEYFIFARNYCKEGRFNCYGQIDVKSDP